MVVPAAPALVEIYNNKLYYDALVNSDFAIPDSGFMVLLLKILKGINIRKLSGVEFFRKFITQADKSLKLFVVDPGINSSEINNSFLNECGFTIPIEHHYVAPMYDRKDISDPILLEKIEEVKPEFIIINLGGGIQEPLGYYLKKNLSINSGIICTGAAIAILNGQQAIMPRWVDMIYLGWFARCIYDPKTFIPRYIKGVKLLKMIIKEKVRSNN